MYPYFLIRFRQAKSILISSEEYAHFLKQSVQLIKFKELNQNKALEIKRLQTQVAYYKKQNTMLRKPEGDDDATDNKIPKVI